MSTDTKDTELSASDNPKRRPTVAKVFVVHFADGEKKTVPLQSDVQLSHVLEKICAKFEKNLSDYVVQDSSGNLLPPTIFMGTVPGNEVTLVERAPTKTAKKEAKHKFSLPLLRKFDKHDKKSTPSTTAETPKLSKAESKASLGSVTAREKPSKKGRGDDLQETLATFRQAVKDNQLTVVADLLKNAEGASYLVNEPSSTDGRAALHTACLEGHKKMVKLLVRNHANLGVRDNQLWSPMHCAIVYKHYGLVKLLVSMGHDIHARNIDGNTCLHYLAIAPKIGPPVEEAFEILVKAGAEVNAVNKNGETPLLRSITRGCVEVCEHLLMAGASLELKDNLGKTPLEIAQTSGDQAKIQLLQQKMSLKQVGSEDKKTLFLNAVAQGNNMLVHEILQEQTATNANNTNPENIFDINNIRLPPEQKTALHIAADEGHLKIVRCLAKKKHNAQPDLTDNFEWTPLHYAAHKGHTAIVVFLAEQGHDPNLGNKDNNTCLHYLVRPKQGVSTQNILKAIDTVLKCGADLDKQNVDGQTPLHTAVIYCKGNTEILHHLLKRGASLDIPDAKGLTALKMALETRNQAVIDLLKEASQPSFKLSSKLPGFFDVSDTPTQMLNKFHAAVREGNLPLVTEMMEANVNLDLHRPAANGKTALHIACAEGQEKVVNYLLACGAVLNQRDSNLWSPLHCASQSKNLAIVPLLLKKGHPPNACNTDGNSSLHYLARISVTSQNSKQVFQAIDGMLAFGAFLDVQNNFGETPLHKAVSGNCAAICQFLVKKGARTDLKNDRGFSPLQIAQEICPDMVPVLSSSKNNPQQRLNLIIHACKEKNLPCNSREQALKSLAASLGIPLPQKM